MTLVAIAVTLTSVDLLQKAIAPAYGHPRGMGYVGAAVLLVVALVILVPRIPSRPLAVAGGIATAGAFGNLASALLWRTGVPNPMVIGDVAFNFADVYAVLGAVSLVLGSLVFAVRHPALLRQPV